MKITTVGIDLGDFTSQSQKPHIGETLGLTSTASQLQWSCMWHVTSALILSAIVPHKLLGCVHVYKIRSRTSKVASRAASVMKNCEIRIVVEKPQDKQFRWHTGCDNQG